MSPRIVLVIGAVAAFVFGAGLLVFPATVLASSGLETGPATIATSRGAGATLIGLGVVNWLGRDAMGDGLRAILAGNVVVQVLSLMVNASGVVTGQLPPQAASASVIHAILAAVFLLGIRRVAL